MVDRSDGFHQNILYLYRDYVPDTKLMCVIHGFVNIKLSGFTKNVTIMIFIKEMLK